MTDSDSNTESKDERSRKWRENHEIKPYSLEYKNERNQINSNSDSNETEGE